MRNFYRLSFGFITFISSFVFFATFALAADITSSWSSATPLPYKVASQVSFSLNNKIYVLGGSSSTGNSQYQVISSSSLSTSNELSPWQNEVNFPTALIFHAIAQKNNNIYILGGKEENPGSAMSSVAAVRLGKINQDGSISSWATMTPLPQGLSLGAAVVVGDRIFFAGGFNDNGENAKIYSSLIDSSGALGAWSEVGSLPEARFGFSMIEQGNSIVILGGYSNNTFLGTAYKATINPNGSLSSWQGVESLPGPVYRGSAIRVNNTLFSVGGNNGTSPLDKIYYTTINTDGNLSPWQTSSNTLPQPVQGASLAYANNTLYLTGGFRDGQYLDTVYFTKLNINSGINLNVPLLKQTALPWGSAEYDSASIWSPQSPSIGAWGCALTSAAMVFQYYGLTQLPDSKTLDPGSLNTWMKQQPDGYVRNGLVNWLALSRLSKQAKAGNPNFSFDALEYKRANTTDMAVLKKDLEESRPDILEQPGHFIVAKGINGSTVSINDTLFNRDTLAPYNNTFLSLGQYIPSNTDLSYLMFVVNPEIEITLKNSSGSAVLGQSFIQQPLSNDLLGTGYSGLPVKILYFPKLRTDIYQATISSTLTVSYQLDTYFYDKNGEVKKNQVTGLSKPNNSRTIRISFNQDTVSSSTGEEQFSIENLKIDLNTYYSLKKINKKVIRELRGKVDKAINYLKRNGKNDKKEAKLTLVSLQKKLNSYKKKYIQEDAYNQLNKEVVYIISKL